MTSTDLLEQALRDIHAELTKARESGSHAKYVSAAIKACAIAERALGGEGSSWPDS